MLIPNQYSLAEANQLVPLLESSLQDIAALLVDMHRARLSVQIRARANQKTHRPPQEANPLQVELDAVNEPLALNVPDAIRATEGAEAEKAPGIGQRWGSKRRRDWPVGIPLEHVVSPPTEVAQAILEAAEAENLANHEGDSDADRALQALLRSAEEFEASAEDLKAMTEAESKIRDELDILQRMGIYVHSMDPPTVHLLSHRGASPVLLSWRPGEPAFMHWHSLDWGIEERAPIDDPKLFGGNVLPS